MKKRTEITLLWIPFGLLAFNGAINTVKTHRLNREVQLAYQNQFDIDLLQSVTGQQQEQLSDQISTDKSIIKILEVMLLEQEILNDGTDRGLRRAIARIKEAE